MLAELEELYCRCSSKAAVVAVRLSEERRKTKAQFTAQRNQYIHLLNQHSPEHGGGGGGGGAPELATDWAAALFVFEFWFEEELALESEVEDMFCVSESFLLLEAASTNRLWHWGHATLVVLGDLSSLWVSSCCSIKVARWISVSADSQITSLIGSFGSILSKCWRILRKCTDCGVSDTYRKNDGSH